MGRPMSEATKEKIRLALKGQIIPETVKMKMRESRRKGIAEGRIVPWNRDKKLIEQRGANNPNWKGGRSVDQYGYVSLRVAGHPNANKKGLIPEHRFVMSEMLGRPLHPWESVHHRNAVRGDNRPANLLLVIRGGHNGRVKCPFCHKEFGVK